VRCDWSRLQGPQQVPRASLLADVWVALWPTCGSVAWPAPPRWPTSCCCCCGYAAIQKLAVVSEQSAIKRVRTTLGRVKPVRYYGTSHRWISVYCLNFDPLSSFRLGWIFVSILGLLLLPPLLILQIAVGSGCRQKIYVGLWFCVSLSQSSALRVNISVMFYFRVP